MNRPVIHSSRGVNSSCLATKAKLLNQASWNREGVFGLLPHPSSVLSSAGFYQEAAAEEVADQLTVSPTRVLGAARPSGGVKDGSLPVPQRPVLLW